MKTEEPTETLSISYDREAYQKRTLPNEILEYLDRFHEKKDKHGIVYSAVKK